MKTRVTPVVPPLLLETLQLGCPALLVTTGADGFPHTAYTWAVALDETTVRFAADVGGTTVTNLAREPRAALQIIAAPDLVYLIKGVAEEVKPQIEAASFKVMMMALAVREVKDQSWPGVTVQPLAYEWPLEQQNTMRTMEQAVYAEMRIWPA
jgi:hypothetical protein